MVTFKNFIMFLDEIGLLRLVFPFLFVFVIVFMFTSELKFLKRKHSLILSVCIAIAAITPHVLGTISPCWDVVVIVNNTLPRIGLFLVFIIVFFVIVSTVGFKIDFLNKFNHWILGLVLLFLGYTFVKSSGCFNIKIPSFPYMDFIIPVVMFLGMIWWLTKPGKEKKKDDEEDDEDYGPY